MELVSHDLIEIMQTLSPGERQSVESHIEDNLATETSREALRTVKRRLKRKARAAKPERPQRKKPGAKAGESRNFVRERKERLSSATADERREGRAAYERHKELCQAHAIAPAPFSAYFDEWLECERSKTLEPAASPDERRQGRDYRRLFEGKRGFDNN
jgi:hypothetical protein